MHYFVQYFCEKLYWFAIALLLLLLCMLPKLFLMLPTFAARAAPRNTSFVSTFDKTSRVGVAVKACRPTNLDIASIFTSAM